MDTLHPASATAARPAVLGRTRLGMSKKLVSKANFLVFGVLITFLAVVGLTMWDRFAAARSARTWTNHTYGVLNAIRELQVSIGNAETSERGYLLTGNQDYLA
jgi:CHASE3 domain sensor protein